MVDVTHADLTGSELHEPKGVENAALGQVYVADGLGSGSWTSIASTSFTGTIADFVAPVPPPGWLECDGSDINIDTYPSLYAVMTIQQTGTRIGGTSIITSLSSTQNMRAGYYVFGAGITAGTKILSVDSGNQITLSANTTSSGTATVVVSPLYLATGIIRLPNFSDEGGRFRRSRTASTSIGQVQADSLKGHTHTGTTATAPAHSHTGSGTTTTESATHSHTYYAGFMASQSLEAGPHSIITGTSGSGYTQTSGQSALHTHNYSFTTSASGAHDHSFTTNSTGDSETRPKSFIVMTCIKT